LKKKVAIVGATGIAGQQFIPALQDHPWYEITGLAASARNAGKTYAKALRDEKTGALRWWCEGFPSTELQGMTVQLADDLDASQYDVVFTAIDTEPARELEPKYAQTTPVISTVSAFRMEPDVPMLIPGVNSDHLKLLDAQRANRGWKGFVTPIPNCTTCGLAITLAPLHRAFGLDKVIMTSMQAISGAGRSPGVLALDIIDNVIPFISGEEEKVQRETQKLLGTLGNGSVVPADFAVSCTCTRVAVLDGHTETVVVSTKEPCNVEQAAAAMRAFGKEIAKLPSGPEHLIHVHEDPFHPQPRVDREAGDGMTTTVGRLRPDSALGGVKYVLLSHNTKMGAAKGAVLVAELLQQNGYL